MTDQVTTKGKTVADAVAEALLQLGARKNEVNITVIDEPKEGVFGFLGRRSAKVEVTKKRRSSKRQSNNRRRPQKTENRPKQNLKPKAAAKKKAPAKEPEQKTQPAKNGRSRVSATPIGEPVKALTITKTIAKTDVSESAQLQQNLSEKLMNICGFPCRCEVTSDEYNRIKIITDADSAGILIGRRGYTIDAIEHLVDRMSARAMSEHVRMNLDVNNYRVRRNSELVADTKVAVTSVLDSGESVHLEPVCARERRLMHMEVADIEGLDTYTSGYGPKRHVVICKEGSRPKREKTCWIKSGPC